MKIGLSIKFTKRNSTNNAQKNIRVNAVTRNENNPLVHTEKNSQKFNYPVGPFSAVPTMTTKLNQLESI
jgi:hypothetical protein